MKLLIDMNLSPRWVSCGSPYAAQRNTGNIHCPTIPDSAALHPGYFYYVVLAHDLDFSAILAATHGEKPSVVQIRAGDVSPEVIGKQVVAALRQMASDLEDGALLTVDPSRTRLRVLPLQPNG